MEANLAVASVLRCSLLLASMTVEPPNDGVVYGRIEEALSSAQHSIRRPILHEP